MGRSVRQIARRRALEAQAKRRQERAEVEQRCSALGIDVVVALSERDAAVERHERAAGVALTELVESEGLTLAEACAWAGEVTVAEGKRLRRLVTRDPGNSSRGV